MGRLRVEEGFSTSLFPAGASRVFLPCPVVCRARVRGDDRRGARGAAGLAAEERQGSRGRGPIRGGHRGDGEGPHMRRGGGLQGGRGGGGAGQGGGGGAGA